MTTPNEARLEAADVGAFILGGNAIFTLVAVETGNRYTFKISKVKDATGKFFVAVLSGPENNSDYTYLGLLEGGVFRSTAKSKTGGTSFKVISWFLGKFFPSFVMPKGVEFWHVGRCAACGRALTVPESIATGMGPTCAEKARM